MSFFSYQLLRDTCILVYLVNDQSSDKTLAEKSRFTPISLLKNTVTL